MDLASSATNTAASAADACRQIWQLCEVWHDAPKDLSQLRDDLAQANEFFCMIQLALVKHTWVRTADWVGQLTCELEECFYKTETVVREAQTILNGLLNVSLTYGVDISNKRRRAMWLRSHGDINRLRGHLKDAMFEICSVLAILDNTGSLGSESTGSFMAKVLEEKGRNPITSIDHDAPHEVHGVDQLVLFNDNRGRPPPVRQVDPLHAVERFNPEQHKSRWVEYKRLGARESIIPSSSSCTEMPSCAETCICACHSVRNAGRWALHSPLLGSLMITYRGVTRRRIPCSNPRCKSANSNAQVIRMDIRPPTWLLHATLSVLLSIGLPSPELVIRVSKVTEVTDVHSSINKLLWVVQREEADGVKHFLQSRLVRSDDLYGDPSNGFTPLRLALDRKSTEVAKILFYSGGFHGTLEGSAASSLLLWLEQEPSAAAFLAQHFPLSAVVEEADYTTLHKIILGLRHLDLHEYLRTPEALAMVNQPNAFGRTPLHVAALRGDAAAVLALLDAGATRDARGNHAKHALHYASKAGSIEVVDALLERGAPLQVRDSMNRTALFDLVGYGSNTNPNLVSHLLALGIVKDPADWVNATLMALSNKRTAAVERLLPYWPPAHELPLYPAIHIGFPDGVRLLLARGADYRTIDAFGEGLLHWLAGSGLEMLRLFKEIGVKNLDVGRRDKMGKRAVDIMEEKWDLTDVFRREFMELIDQLTVETEEGGSTLMKSEGEAVEVEDEDGILSEDEFFDAVDTFTTTKTVPEGETGCQSPAEEEPSSEPATAQSPDSWASEVEAVLPNAAEQEALDCEPNDIEARHEETATDSETVTPDDSNSDSISSGHGQYTFSGGEEEEPWTADQASLGSDSEPKYSGNPRDVDLGVEKVFTDEAGLKFLGTSATLRGQ